MTDIIFTKTFEIPEDYFPKPADKYVPDWYKNLESYIGGEKKPSGEGQTTGTVKRCMPVFDAVTGGYIIPTYVDIFITQKQIFDSKRKAEYIFRIRVSKKAEWKILHHFSSIG